MSSKIEHRLYRQNADITNDAQEFTPNPDQSEFSPPCGGCGVCGGCGKCAQCGKCGTCGSCKGCKGCKVNES